jgi:DNA recombination protein RmuC
MEIIMAALLSIIGLLVGAGLVWFRLKSVSEQKAVAEAKNLRIPELESLLAKKEEQILALQNEITNLKTSLTEYKVKLEEERKTSDKNLAILNEAKEKLSDAFKALASDALKSNEKSFLELATTKLGNFQINAANDLEGRKKAIEQLVQPMQTLLGEVKQKIEIAEKERGLDHVALTSHLKSVAQAQENLKQGTDNLVKALRKPEVRGHWGEVQLKRTVEIA